MEYVFRFVKDLEYGFRFVLLNGTIFYKVLNASLGNSVGFAQQRTKDE